MATTIQSGRSSSPLLTADVASRAEVYGGRGLVFDGATDYLSVDDGGVNGNGLFDHVNVSVSFWTKIPTSGSSFPMYPLATFNGIQIAQFVFTMNSATQLIIQNNNSSSPISNISTIETGTWEHWVVTREPWSGQSNADAHQFKVYRNGELIATIQQNSQWLLHKANLTIGRKGGNDSGYFNGSMCDMKIWTGYTLSLSEVQQIYKKPETSAPSASLSYLSAWYPMCEGNPESPQSIVYDHSEKKLGGDFARAVVADSWSAYANMTVNSITGGVSIVAPTTASGDSVSGNGAYIYFRGGTFFGENQLTTKDLTVGKTYCVTFNAFYSGGASGVYADISNGSSVSSFSDAFTTTNKSYKMYFNAGTATTALIRFQQIKLDNTVYITDIEVKEVLMGHHATTKFYGEELFDADASTVDSGTHSWVAYSGATMTNDSGAIKIVCNPSQGNGAYLKFADALDLTTDLTVGTTYRLSCSVKVDTGDVRLDMANATGFSYIDVTETSFTTKTIDFVAGHATNTFVYTHRGQGSIIWLDNFSLKEIGISSSGFTTAQNEPTIPQIPLVKYNEKMLFDGVDDIVATSGNSPISGSNSFTMSAWIIPFIDVPDTSNDYMTFIKQGSTSANQMACFAIARVSNVNYLGYLAHTNDLYSNHVVPNNTWSHVVVTYSSGTYASGLKIYLNGIVNSSLTAKYGATSGTPNIASSVIEIGKSQDGNSAYWNGIVDELSYFNTALSATEVQELFNDGVACDATTHSKSANLIGYWRNDGITQWIDRSTNSNHGTVAGTPDAITIREGLNSNKDGLGFPLKNPTGNVLRLNGVNEYVSIPPSDMSLSSQMTIEFWAKHNTGDSSGEQIVDQYDYNNNQRSYRLSIQSDEKLKFDVTSSGGSDFNRYNSDSAVSNINNWRHYAITFSSGSVIMYVDSEVFANTHSTTDGGTSIFNNTTDNLRIGSAWSASDAGTNIWNGLLDEVRIYNRALSATEVSKNYKHGKGKHKND